LVGRLSYDRIRFVNYRLEVRFLSPAPPFSSTYCMSVFLKIGRCYYGVRKVGTKPVRR
jgi:hypothetical protein